MYQQTIKMEKKVKNLNFDWKRKRILDFGCNMGTLGTYVLDQGASDYIGIDIRAEEIKEGKRIDKRLKLYVGDLLEYTRLGTDVLCLFAILHHLSEDLIDKILKDSTAREIVCEVPIGEGKYPYPNDNRILRTEEWYRNKFEEFDFKVKEVVESGATNDPYFKRIILVCKKV